MTIRSTALAGAVALVAAIGLAGSALADSLVSNFDSFNLGGTYGNWANAGLTTITSNPTNYQIESVGFGGGFHDVTPSASGTGQNTVEFDVTVNAGGGPNVLAVLEDGDGTQVNYRWYTLPTGHTVLTQPLSPSSGFNGVSYDTFPGAPGSIAGFNPTTIPFFHIQVDSGPAYDISFNNLRLTVPEPATFTLCAAGLAGLVLASARRRV